MLKFDKDVKTPDPIPKAGIETAVKLMTEGRLYRYNHDDDQSEVSKCENDLAGYLGMKYVVGFNSCGSAIFISLKCVGVQFGDYVLLNGFSFTAVPSAVEHCGAQTVFVDCNDHYILDPVDLDKKATSSGAKVLLLTYMRGKVPDMEKIMAVAQKHDLVIVEDAAHALGVKWNNKRIGTFGKVSCFSSQSYKLLNSGEGGFLCTDDDVMAAKAICYAGCYESLNEKHVLRPPKDIFDMVKKKTPNYSLRMSNLTAAVIRPQLLHIQERIDTYNRRYSTIGKLLEDGHALLTVPRQLPAVSEVADSLQFNVRHHPEVSSSTIKLFLEACASRGIPISLFGSPDNARNIRNWQYCDLSALEVPETEATIARALDVRLPLQFKEEDFVKMGQVIVDAAKEVWPGKYVDGRCAYDSRVSAH